MLLTRRNLSKLEFGGVQTLLAPRQRTAKRPRTRVRASEAKEEAVAKRRVSAPPRHGAAKTAKPHRSGLSNTASLSGTFTRSSFSIARQLPSGRDTHAGW